MVLLRQKTTNRIMDALVGRLVGWQGGRSCVLASEARPKAYFGAHWIAAHQLRRAAFA